MPNRRSHLAASSPGLFPAIPLLRAPQSQVRLALTRTGFA
jgi:hypothetical protein